MINIFSINCALALVPYLTESLADFIERGSAASRVVRQGGSGLIIRSDGRLVLRHQNQEAALEAECAKHYRATVEFRRSFYDVKRLSDEVVFANVGRSLLLSHPQSSMWLDTAVLSGLLSEGRGRAGLQSGGEAEARAPLPDWLRTSSGDGRLLISDQRSGRWVLLGSDHLSEMERRLRSLEEATEPGPVASPPTILVKGVVVHLQSAFRLARALETFAESGQAEAYEEAAPDYYLRVARSVEGIELADSNLRVGVTAREARKWAAIIREELSRLQAEEVERGQIRTVFVKGGGGLWVLQAGDEVFVTDESLARLDSSGVGARGHDEARPAVGRIDGFTVFLEEKTGGCVALTGEEMGRLAAA